MSHRSGITPWFKNVTPHADIRDGHLDESVFAANLAQVSEGKGREIYQDPRAFFRKTYVTKGMQTVARRVLQGLNGGQQAENRVISLQTGFGGGKTHLLIALYHLAKYGPIMPPSLLDELLATIDPPKYREAKIAVFTNKTNDPTQGRHIGDLHIRTLWGELAFQLGGQQAFEHIRANDENRVSPKGLFADILAKTKPCLILIDELADYCVAASGVAVAGSTLADQTTSFVQELTEAVSATPQSVLVATLPASPLEVASSSHAAQILTSLAARMGRVGADTKPIADEEVFQVIRRRLFEDIGDVETIKQVVDAYMSLYQNLSSEIPANATRMEYADMLYKSYPFHPELIDMFRIRWASHHDFQRTRGVLRLLASIVADLWKRQNSLTGSHALIHTADVHIANLDDLSGQLKKLYGNGYDAVISADVAGSSANSFKIDQDKKEYGVHNLTQGIAATVLLASFGSTGANRGVSVAEIKLSVMRPGAFNHNSINGALDALESRAHYLYYSSAGAATKRYWFHTKPNINILVNQAKSSVSASEIEKEIQSRLAQQTKNVQLFNVLVNPTGEVPEQTRLTLILLGPSFLAGLDRIESKTLAVIEQISTKRGNQERIYRNTMLFLVSSEIGAAKLTTDLREYLACVKILAEYATQLETDQKNDLKGKIENFSRQVSQSLVSAYSIVIKHSAGEGIKKLVLRQFKDSLDLQINVNMVQALKDEEWLLELVGLLTLEKHNLVPSETSAVKVKDIYEAFLRFDDKPMITGIQSVQASLQRYCSNGEFAIAAGDGKLFNKMWYKETAPFFDVTDGSYWLLHKSCYTVKSAVDVQEPKSVVKNGLELSQPSIPGIAVPKSIKSLAICGKVDIANYHQLFSSFIMPLAQNQIEIEIKIKAKATESSPLNENSTQYKIAKESAKQLGLDFKEE